MENQKESDEAGAVEVVSVAQKISSPKITPRAQSPPTATNAPPNTPQPAAAAPSFSSSSAPAPAPAAVAASTAPLVVSTAAAPAPTASAASPTTNAPAAAAIAPHPTTPMRTSHSAGAIPSSRKGARSSPARSEA